MKAIVLLFATACLINGLAAYTINYPLEEEKPEVDESEIDNYLNIFFPSDNNAENLIVPFPTDDPTEPPTESPTEPPTDPPTQPPTDPPTQSPTYPPTEPPTQPPTDPTTHFPSTPTTTWKPTTSTTRRPIPPPPRPEPGRKNPQIYNNAVRSLGPFASRLVNVVLNRQGAQKTVQENEIVYNLNSFLNVNETHPDQE